MRLKISNILIGFLAAAVLMLAAPFFSVHNARAQDVASAGDSVAISVFVRDDCRHCRDEKEFLARIVAELPRVDVRYYDITDATNAELFKQVTATYGFSRGTPVTMIRDTLLQGFEAADTTGVVMRRLIDGGNGPNLRFEDVIEGTAQVYTGTGSVCDETTACGIDEAFTVKVPLVGTTISVGGFSLGTLSLVLGFVDGFNPCALWVLLMFLLILSQAGSRKRMFQFAGLFILAEAVMYYLILNVWFTAWDFIGLNRIVTPFIGLLALGSGVYFVYKFVTFKNECAIVGPDGQKTIRMRVKNLVGKPLTLGVIAGILGLAFSVNVFEFACSIGIPQTFTKVLELNNLAWLGRQWYMFLYVLMYMVDDLIVFGLALWGLDKMGLTHKYSKWATLVGGLLMLALGLIMLFKPELLIF